MEMCSLGPPLTTLVVFIFIFLLAFSTSIVQSQISDIQPPSPISKSSEPLPPSSPPSPPSQKRHSPPSPRPPRKHMKRRPPPAPLRMRHAGNMAKAKKSRGLNLGKKVGLLFAGTAVFLQFGVVGFLVYKKKQLYKLRD